MKTATIREAQHHLSKLVDEITETREEVVLTRRGIQVCRITPIIPDQETEVDWAGWLKDQREFLKSMPMIEGSAMDAEREGYRW